MLCCLHDRLQTPFHLFIGEIYSIERWDQRLDAVAFAGIIRGSATVDKAILTISQSIGGSRTPATSPACVNRHIRQSWSGVETNLMRHRRLQTCNVVSETGCCNARLGKGATPSPDTVAIGWVGKSLRLRKPLLKWLPSPQTVARIWIKYKNRLSYTPGHIFLPSPCGSVSGADRNFVILGRRERNRTNTCPTLGMHLQRR